MCISPIKILNPNYKKSKQGLNYLKDTVHQYLSVPCGYCCECIFRRQSDYVQRLLVEEMNHHLFFCTLTYNNECIPILTDSNGFSHKYADVHDIQNMIKRLRKRNAFGRNFSYFAVSELGSKRGRPHFHLVFSVDKKDSDDFLDVQNLESLMFKEVLFEWRRNIGTNKFPKYLNLCTFKRVYTSNGVKSNFDLHYINPRSSSSDSSDVGFYVMKYMLKPSDRVVKLQRALRLNLSEDEYNDVWKTIRPRCFKSLHFGDDKFVDGKPASFDVEKYIVDCINKSPKDKYPMFFNPHSGQSFVLADYYKKRFLTVKTASLFPRPDERDEPEHDHVSQLLIKEFHHEKVKSISENRDLFGDYFPSS